MDRRRVLIRVVLGALVLAALVLTAFGSSDKLRQASLLAGLIAMLSPAATRSENAAGSPSPRRAGSPTITLHRARSSVGERSLHTREVAGSSPAVPITESSC